MIALADPEITPDLVRWADRAARRYAVRYGDPDGRFACVPGTALDLARRTWRASGAPFPSHARRVVVEGLNEALRRSGPMGYRRDPRRPGNHLGRPAVGQLSAAPERASGEPPVGWETDFEDFVTTLARGLPGPESAAFRAMYLEAAGGTVTRAAAELGLSHNYLSDLHARAIARVRRHLGVATP